jgi:NTP pyrophosphatase (non-canonical NTP hydrolase)
MDKILGEIKHERKRQDDKWGPQNHAPMVWNGILAEEFGEVAKAVNEVHFSEQPGELRNSWLKNYREELIQTAAVCVAAVESLDRNELKPKEDEHGATKKITY